MSDAARRISVHASTGPARSGFVSDNRVLRGEGIAKSSSGNTTDFASPGDIFRKRAAIRPQESCLPLAILKSDNLNRFDCDRFAQPPIRWNSDSR